MSYCVEKYDDKMLQALGVYNVLKLCREENNKSLDYIENRIIKEVEDIIDMFLYCSSYSIELNLYDKVTKKVYEVDMENLDFIDTLECGIHNGNLFSIWIELYTSKDYYKKFKEFSLNCTFVTLSVHLNQDEEHLTSCMVLEGFEDCITCNVKNCEYTDLKDSERIFYDGGRIITFDDYEYDELLRTLLNIQEHMYIRFRMKFYNMDYSFRYGSVSTEYERFLYVVSDINKSQYWNNKTLLKACKLIQCLYEEICQTRELGKDSFHYMLRHFKQYNFKTVYECKWLSRYLKLRIFKKMGLLVSNLEIPYKL